MDIPRPDQTRKKQIRRILVATIGLAAITLITVALSRLKPAAPSVDKASVWSDAVKRGSMLREVRGNGTLVPEEIRWITAASPGRVERILLLPGVTVKPDTVIIELSNPELEQAAFDAESQLRGAESQLERLKAQLDNDRLTQESAISNLKSDLTLAEIEADAQESLLESGLIPSLIAKRYRATANELKTRHQMETKRLANMDRSAKAQLVAQESDLEKFRQQSRLRKQQVAALRVQAGMEGVLQRLGDGPPLQSGQQLGAGANIARIANPAKLKAEIKIAETQAKDIQHGQSVSIDTRNGLIPGHVVRIDPSVLNGTVTVDVALDAPLPKGARPDLSVDGSITLEKLEDVLYVGRPVSAQAESKASLFKIIDGGRAAVRVSVKLGRSSVSSIEVVQGLEIGDLVILSDTAQWDACDRIRLN
jgi:HlyD family secretion protein